MIVNPACNWVVARLPLSVSGSGEPVGRSAEEGDLGVDELRAVRRHLVACATCRERESSMRQAAEALAVAAICAPAQTDSSSLWPEMQRRITVQGSARPAAVETGREWLQLAWMRADGLLWSWLSLDGMDRLRGAWFRDGLREALDAAIAATSRGSRLRVGLIAGSGLAAIVAAIGIVLPAMQQQESTARAVIASNESAPAELAGPPRPGITTVLEHSPPAVNIDTPAEGLLAQAEPTRPVEAAPPPAAEAAPVVKAPAPPTRFNFDLEHGTPMPPDSRDPKPVY